MFIKAHIFTQAKMESKKSIKRRSFIFQGQIKAKRFSRFEIFFKPFFILSKIHVVLAFYIYYTKVRKKSIWARINLTIWHIVHILVLCLSTLIIVYLDIFLFGNLKNHNGQSKVYHPDWFDLLYEVWSILFVFKILNNFSIQCKTVILLLNKVICSPLFSSLSIHNSSYASLI
jgi:hypothetical protein